MGITRDNHFVPELYLKNFASAGKVSEYRLLVPNANLRLWNSFNISGTGYVRNLYTRIVQGEEVDDIEKWLNRDFETPAYESLQKVLSDKDLTSRDWERLIRLLASQIVRTPAFLVKNLPRWNKMTRRALDETFKKDVEVLLRQGKASGEKVTNVPSSLISGSATLYAEYIPLKVKRKEIPEEGMVQFSGEIIVGRGIWFFAMKRMLTETLRVLQKHAWTILEAPAKLHWFTSDDPVVCLNFRSESDYDFEGGWNRAQGCILFPLTPRHLMFTQIGAKPYPRKVPSGYHARLFRRIIAEHAHRKIYSIKEDEKIPQLRPRIADAKIFQDENTLWKTWYENQSKAEQEL